METNTLQGVYDAYKSGDFGKTQDILNSNKLGLEDVSSYFNLLPEDLTYLNNQGVTGYQGAAATPEYASSLIESLRGSADTVNPNTGFKTWANKANAAPLNWVKSPAAGLNKVVAGDGSGTAYVPRTAPPLKSALGLQASQDWNNLGIKSDPVTGLPTNMSDVDLGGFEQMLVDKQITADQARSTYNLNDDDMRWLDDIYDVDFYTNWGKQAVDANQANDMSALQNVITSNKVTQDQAVDQFDLTPEDVSWLTEHENMSFYDPNTDIMNAFKAGDYYTVNALKDQYDLPMSSLASTFKLGADDLAYLANLGIK